ncbi:MAG: mechanosensitive ion channel family protein [Gemmatimonadaceae bacterium]|jgi:MscS family membrane protein
MVLSLLTQLDAVQQRGEASMIWIRDHLPAAFQGMGPLGIAWWQWAALALLVPAAVVIGAVLVRPLQGVLRRLVATTEATWDDQLVEQVRGPIILMVSAIASRVLIGWVTLAAGPLGRVVDLHQAAMVVALFWALLRVVGVIQRGAPTSQFVAHRPALRSLIPLAARIARVLLVILALLSVAAAFGYPVATILAGLGIGGIAIALGAQKTLENVFGSVSIGIDQPFRVGDVVNIDGVDGEIEAIGLRSTRIRTPERTVVSIPNGRLADMRAENFGERDRFRFRTVVGLEYGTSVDTIQQVRDGIEALLRTQATTWPEIVNVRLAALGPSSIDIEVVCWVLVSAPFEFRRVREQYLLGIMRVVEAAGASFAFPTQTVHLRGMTDAHRPLG